MEPPTTFHTASAVPKQITFRKQKGRKLQFIKSILDWTLPYKKLVIYNQSSRLIESRVNLVPFQKTFPTNDPIVSVP